MTGLFEVIHSIVGVVSDWRLLVPAVIAAVLGGGVLAAFIVGFIWDRVLGYLVRRTSYTLDDQLVRASHRPVVVLAFVVALQMGQGYLNSLPGLTGTSFSLWFDRITYIVGVLAAAVWLEAISRTILEWYITRTGSESAPRFVPIARFFLRLLIFFIAVTVILDHFRVNITGFVATAGIASLAIALAAQDTLGNLISGLMLVLDRPFRPGDRIEVGTGLVGDVLETGLRTTKILTLNNSVIIVPNKELAQSRIINMGYPSPQLTVRLQVGIGYDSDVERAKEIILQILREHPDVLPEPAPAVFFTDFGDSALILVITFAVDNYLKQFQVRDEVNRAILNAFRAEGIEIPFPQRVVHCRCQHCRS